MKFSKKQNLNIVLLSDPEHIALEKYGTWQEKNMLGKKYFGVSRTTFLINPDGKIAFIWKKVKVQGHIENVLEKLIKLNS